MTPTPGPVGPPGPRTGRGRHTAPAPPSGARRPTAATVVVGLVVGTAVLLVVGLGGVAASWLDAEGTASSAARPTAPDPSPGTEGPSPAGRSSAGGSLLGPSPGASSAGSPAPPADSGASAPPGDPIPGPGAAVVAADGVVPTSLAVPAVDLDVPLTGLGLREDGSIDVPGDPDDAGWLRASAVPGRTGPAVLAGHVDSATGVAVFTRLEELVVGDEVAVGLSDGTTVRYEVTGSERYPKDAFPSARVYGPAPASVLRLVTCGGTFDRAAGSYEDNLVVYAVPSA